MGFKQNEIEQLLVDTGRRCCLCRIIHKIQVHHITPKEEGGTDDIDNAIPLCPNCHDEIHIRSNNKCRLSRTYTDGELKLHRQKTINLIENELKLSPGTILLDQDKELILFYMQCLDRPAFRIYFHQEISFTAFDKAMEDTLLALNTGYWRTRDGTIIDRAKGKSYIVNPKWRDKLDRIVKLIEEIRNKFHNALGFNSMLFEIHNSINYDKILRQNRELGSWMDTKRDEAIELLNQILLEIKHSPLKTIYNR